MCEKQDKDEQRYAEKYADYVKMLKNTLSKKRFTHSMNVASMCLALAKKHGGDEEKAYLAGLLHDIKKEETPNAMKSQAILEQYGRERRGTLYPGTVARSGRCISHIEKSRYKGY